MKLSAWRVALRVARRDALRAKGRSALVIAMIAIPVIGVAGADVTYRSSELSVQQKATRMMGTADAYVSAGQLGWRTVQGPDPANGTDILSYDGATNPTPTPQEKARADEPLARQLEQALPAGARLLPVDDDQMLTTSTAAGVLQVQVQGIDLADPLTHGMAVLDQGSWPDAPGRIAATTAFLKQSGLRVGQTTTPAGTHRPLTITAAVEFPSDLRDAQLVLRPDDLTAVVAAQNAGTARAATQAAPPHDWLLAMPGHAAFSWADVLQANDWGFTVTSRAVLLNPPPADEVRYHPAQGANGVDSAMVAVLTTVVGMALLEIVLLAGPAFAVGARRSRRQLGLIAAGGGDRAHIRAVVLGGGVVLGGTGALIGLVVGALAVALGRGELESLSGSRFGAYTLRPVDLLGIVLVGLVTGLLAAVVPALQAARQDVVSSLTGRGTVKAPPAWLTVLGGLAVGGGALIALLGLGTGQGGMSILGGSMLAELGLVACTPALVGLFGRLARLLPLGPRLALRDSTRNRGRTAPAVAAVMAAVAGAVAVSVYQSSSESASRAVYQASGPMGSVLLQFNPSDTAARIATETSAVQTSATDLGPRGDVYQLYYRGNCLLDGSGLCGNVTVQPAPSAHCPATDGSAAGPVTLSQECARTLLGDDNLDGQSVVAASPAALPALLGIHDPAATRALAAGTVLVTDPDNVVDGRITLALQLQKQDSSGSDSGAGTRTVSLPAMVVTAHPAVVQALISPEAATRAGLGTSQMGSAWLPPQPVTGAEEQRINAALGRVVNESSLTVEHGYQSTSSSIAIGLALAASVVAIGAAASATGLAAADSQADLATLAAVGAAPGIRRRLSGFQCAVIAGMGAVLGTAAGIVPAWALWRYRGQGTGMNFSYLAGTTFRAPAVTYSLVLPWGTLAALVLGLPLLAWLLAAGLTRSRVVLTRRTA